MSLPPRLRKTVLTLHISTSVGWFGAVLAYLALDITAVTSNDPQTVRGASVCESVPGAARMADAGLHSVVRDKVVQRTERQ